MSEASTMDRLVASKAAADDFTRTRWWWIRHAPVRVDEGRIYGQRDLPCDCSDAPVFSGLAALLPQDAIWVTSSSGAHGADGESDPGSGKFRGPGNSPGQGPCRATSRRLAGARPPQLSPGPAAGAGTPSGTRPRTSGRRTAKASSTSSSGSVPPSRG